jgi:hypothetical protein
MNIFPPDFHRSLNAYSRTRTRRHVAEILLGGRPVLPGGSVDTGGVGHLEIENESKVCDRTTRWIAVAFLVELLLELETE